LCLWEQELLPLSWPSQADRAWTCPWPTCSLSRYQAQQRAPDTAL